MAELERTCSNCKYDMSVYSCSTKEKIMHCYRCSARDEGRNQFLSREADYPSLDCKDCRHSKKEYSEAPCSECVEHSNFEKKRKKTSPTPSSSESEKPTEESVPTCAGCAYDFRESVWTNCEKDYKNKNMYCGSCHKRGVEENRLMVYYTKKLDKRDCKNCKHYNESFYQSGTPCSECDRYSNYDEAKPTPMFEDDISAEETQSVVKNVNDAVADLAFGMNPCTACEFSETDNEDSNCKGCCFNFPSKFKLRGAK